MRPLFNFTLALAGGLLLVQLTVHTLRDRAIRKPAAVAMAVLPSAPLMPAILLPEKSS